jgi:hypothetical protein
MNRPQTSARRVERQQSARPQKKTEATLRQAQQPETGRRPDVTDLQLLALQRLAGNAAVVAMLQANATSVQRQDGTFSEMAATVSKALWRGTGVKGPKDLRPPTGLGGFAAAYDPRSEVLNIVLSGGVNFVDGISIDDHGVLSAAHANFGNAVTVLMALPLARRREAVKAWQWTNEKAAWIQTFTQAVESVWSQRYDFHCKKPYWEDVNASVRVDVKIHDGAKQASEHMSLTTFKVPTGFAGGVGVVNSGAGGATNNTMTITSADVVPRTDNLLIWDVQFGARRVQLTHGASDRVQSLAKTFKAGSPRCSSCGRMVPELGGPVLTIECQGDSRLPERSAHARFVAIKNALVAGGFVRADERVRERYAGKGHVCKLRSESGVPQTIAAHEAGHMLGLGDQYATGAGSMITGTGAGAGTASAHDQLAKDMGLEGAIHENNDNIMSLGNVVRPEHYVTFFWALQQVTDIPEWELRTQALGDFPVAKPREGQAVAV